MKRSDYLCDRNVQAFVGWVAKLVTGERGLRHIWQGGPNQGNLRCESLYEAFESYYWRGDSFVDMADKLDEFRRAFGRATAGDPATDEGKSCFLETAVKVTEWGGEPPESLLSLGSSALEKLTCNADRLNPKHADTLGLKGFSHMGSSYSKIYSLLLDDFPIYDSRVGCGLTSLIREFCREQALNEVPLLLQLRIPLAFGEQSPTVEPVGTTKLRFNVPQKQRRNPSTDTYKFRDIHTNLDYSWRSHHADSNLKAAWILGEAIALADKDGDFNGVRVERRFLALQAALFMIGHVPLGEGAVSEM